MKPGAARKSLFPRLAKRLCHGVLAEGLRGLSLWAALAAAIWSIGNALFLLFSPPWWATTALGLALLSIAPAFFFAAISEFALERNLRSLDEGTTIEAALSPGSGPASRLIEDRARAIDESIPYKKPARISPFQGMGGFWLAALACLVLLELLALVVVHKPILAYRPRESVAGSGLAVTDSGVLRPLNAIEATKEDEEGSQAEPRKENLPTGGSVAISQEELQAAFENLARTREERLAKSEGGTAPASSSGGEAQDQGSEARKGETAEGNGGGLGEPLPGDAGSRAKGKNAMGRGYEGSESGLPPNPLIDYRARLFQALTERGGQGITTGESLDAAALRKFQKRFFGSFTINAPMASHEDSYSTMLKLRWRNLNEAFR